MIIIQTKDHYFIARYLSKEIGLCFCPVKRAAFVLGSVFPDVNVFSYFKGNGLKGHSYRYSRRFISNTMSCFEKQEAKSPADWFRIGVALHYVQDSFTYAHNECFKGGIIKHFEYENRLHEQLGNSFDRIALKMTRDKPYNYSDRIIGKLYKSYRTKDIHTTESDTAYILMSSLSFLNCVGQ